MRSFLLALSLLIGLNSCSEQTPPASSQQQPAQAFARPALDQLSQQEAATRKARVSNIAYNLDINLASETDSYSGTVIAQFDLATNDGPLDIDFTGGSVNAVTVNGEALTTDYNGFYLLLPNSALQLGANTVSIEYSHPFDQDGTGLHKFTDPEDGNVYLYTYLWPYYSNRLFPNFDQPNLKATYELTVHADPSWQVISAMTEDSVTANGDVATWHFPESEKFSSYIFSLHAGPYQVWEDMAGDVPIRLMARQSLAEYVDVEEWMTYTKSGLAHYGDYFDIHYPFVKYDQVIVPDFLIGAMENVAAVTFSESYVDRGAGNRFNSQRRASTILHEMAHMWFGDLVTMNWWNGLWLNESFATLMSAIAVFEATEFDDLWHDFYLSENLTAISADSAVSTHPIEVEVASSNDFFNVFDAITYDKGASVLNQLSHYIGRENFRIGVSNYLKQHSWDNTDLADFMSALSNQSGIDLGPWADDWMYQAGVNQIEARYSCDANQIESFAILQTAPDNLPTIRSQRVQLGLFATDGNGEIAPYASIAVEINSAETQVPEAIGQPCPELALPNYEGWGYATIKLDNRSVTSLISDAALAKTSDPLLRSMFWTAMIDAPSNDQLEQAQLLEMLVNSLPAEQNDRIMRQTLSELVGRFNRLERMGASYAEELASYGVMAEQQLWALALEGVFENNDQGYSQSESTLNLRLDNYINLARSDSALSNLISLMNDDFQIQGLTVGQGLRWNIIQRLTNRDHPQARNLLQAEQIRDPSDAGRRAAIAAESALPDTAIKQAWLDRILESETPLPLSNLRASMTSLFPPGQEQFQLDLLPQMTANLEALAQTRDNYYLRTYGQALFSGICDQQGLEILASATANPDALGATLYRFMSENVEDGQNCVAAKTR
ncbi:MAG: aminopeptidase N [Pseudohongiellaceae bacterium]|jgi:aminopeptidase N